MNSTTCKEKYLEWLEGIPHQWKCSIAEAMCSSMSESATLDCNQVKNCETVTSLSDFVVSGTVVCIHYTDEEGTDVERCFDFDEVMNNSLDGVVPNCLTSPEQWAAFSYVEKIQAIVDKVCENCDETTTTTTTTIP